MCHKLLQIYHCGHSEEVCTTPCPHALATATHKNAIPGGDTAASIRGSISLPNSPSPIESSQAAGATRPSPDETLPSQQDQISSGYPGSPRHPPHGLTRNESVFHPQEPAVGAASPSPPPYQDQAELIPNVCPYFFARELPQSNCPCWRCYMNPEYTTYRNRWIKDYRIGHPGTRPEDLARLAGVDHIAERAGPVNVVAEMQRMESAKRDEHEVKAS